MWVDELLQRHQQHTDQSQPHKFEYCKITTIDPPERWLTIRVVEWVVILWTVLHIIHHAGQQQSGETVIFKLQATRPQGCPRVSVSGCHKVWCLYQKQTSKIQILDFMVFSIQSHHQSSSTTTRTGTTKWYNWKTLVRYLCWSVGGLIEHQHNMFFFKKTHLYKWSSEKS